MVYLLVTNDDGIDAPGIQALAAAMKRLGDVRVSAPSSNQSASGHKKTLFQDIPFRKTELADGTPALAVGGSPADCIAISALGAQKWPPRLVVSGINRGANMGQDITYSGTVTAALEATINGVPGIAISLDNHNANTAEDYAAAANVAFAVVKRALEQVIPAFTIINVNVPAGKVKGLRVARQGVRIYRDVLVQNGDSYRIAGDLPSGILTEQGTDMWAVNNGYASITPIHLDMTAHKFMADLAAWDIEL